MNSPHSLRLDYLLNTTTKKEGHLFPGGHFAWVQEYPKYLYE